MNHFHETILPIKIVVIAGIGKHSLVEETHKGLLSVKALKAQAKRSQDAVKAERARQKVRAGQMVLAKV